jgi:hypothetical protein
MHRYMPSKLDDSGANVFVDSASAKMTQISRFTEFVYSARKFKLYAARPIDASGCCFLP